MIDHPRYTAARSGKRTSDKNGNYIIGTLPKSGQYLVHAEKSGVGVDEAARRRPARQLHDR